MQRITIIVILLNMLAACGGGNTASGGGDVYRPRAATYTLPADAVPSCHAPSRESVYFAPEGYQVKTCEWFCAKDSNYDHQSVTVTFNNNRSSKQWGLASVTTAAGVCNRL